MALLHADGVADMPMRVDHTGDHGLAGERHALRTGRNDDRRVRADRDDLAAANQDRRVVDRRAAGAVDDACAGKRDRRAGLLRRSRDREQRDRRAGEQQGGRFHRDTIIRAVIHQPIMLAETLRCLAPRPGNLAVDCTLGGGALARAILDRIQPGGRLIGLDLDAAELARTELQLRREGWEPPTFVARHRSFAALSQLLGAEGLRGCRSDRRRPRRLDDAD